MIPRRIRLSLLMLIDASAQNPAPPIAPHDWKRFPDRVDALHPVVHIDGLTRGGYRYVSTETIPSWLTRTETRS